MRPCEVCNQPLEDWEVARCELCGLQIDSINQKKERKDDVQGLRPEEPD